MRIRSPMDAAPFPDHRAIMPLRFCAMKDTMATYLAHYQSPVASDSRATGFFEFESDARCGSRENANHARLRMLELYGKEAVSWSIDKIEKKKATNEALDGQLELDFRPEKKKPRKAKKEYW